MFFKEINTFIQYECIRLIKSGGKHSTFIILQMISVSTFYLNSLFIKESGKKPIILKHLTLAYTICDNWHYKQCWGKLLWKVKHYNIVLP